MMGPLITQSLAQLQASERAVTKPGATKRGADARRRPEDAYESIASAIDPARAARRLSGNDQEDAHEDRQEHQPPQHTLPKHGEHKGIDVSG